MIKRLALLVTLLLSLTISSICNANFFEDGKWKLVGDEGKTKLYALPESCEFSKTTPRTATILTGVYVPEGMLGPNPKLGPIHYAVNKMRYYENDLTKFTILTVTFYDINGDIIDSINAPMDRPINVENRQDVHDDFFGKDGKKK